MSNDADLVRRIRTAVELVPAEPPPVEPAIRAGRMRRVRQVGALTLAIGVVVAGTAWAVFGLSSLHGAEHVPSVHHSFDPGTTRLIQTPYGPEIPIPHGWFTRSAVIPDNVDFVLTTARSTLNAAIQGCGPSDRSCETHEIGAQDVGAHDAFIWVWIFHGVCQACAPSPLPDRLTPADFAPVGTILGTRVWQVQRWIDDGEQVQVRYWVGPGADSGTTQAVRFVVGHLNLPRPRFDPAVDTHPVMVPYSRNPVPVPNGWTARSAGLQDQSGFMIGLVASTDRAGVKRTSPCGSCGIRSFDVAQARPSDAMVEVDVLDRPCSEACPAPLPWRIRFDAFTSVGPVNGADLYGLVGTGRNGVRYTIRFWIGPEANSRTQDEALSLVESLHIPREPSPSHG